MNTTTNFPTATSNRTSNWVQIIYDDCVIRRRTLNKVGAHNLVGIDRKAIRLTVVSELKLAIQVPPQLIPAGLLVIVPLLGLALKTESEFIAVGCIATVVLTP